MDGWIPDDGLVEKVRLVGYSLRDLPEDSKDIDRIWIVVALSSLGWTAQEIADRMDCSLRLIRNIKAEQPAYGLAVYAFGLRSQILAIAGTCRIEVSSMRQQLMAQDAQLDQLRRQRSQLIDQLKLERLRTVLDKSIAAPRGTEQRHEEMQTLRQSSVQRHVP